MRKLLAHRSFRVSTILVILAVTASILFNRWSSSPGSTTIQITQPTVHAEEATYQSVQTALFTTEVPDGWKLRTNSLPNDPRIQLVAVAPAPSNVQAGFTAGLMPSDGLSGLGEYKLRSSDTADYKRADDPALPDVQLFAAVATPADLTAFLSQNGHYAVIALSGYDTASHAHDMLAHILVTWSWHS